VEEANRGECGPTRNMGVGIGGDPGAFEWFEG